MGAEELRIRDETRGEARGQRVKHVQGCKSNRNEMNLNKRIQFVHTRFGFRTKRVPDGVGVMKGGDQN